MEKMHITNDQRIKREYYGKLKVPYFLLKNWFSLSLHIQGFGCIMDNSKWHRKCRWLKKNLKKISHP